MKTMTISRFILPQIGLTNLYIFHENSLKKPKGSQHSYIEEEQTTQWPKEKEQKDKHRSTKHTYKTHKSKHRVTRTPLKTGGNSGALKG